MKNRDIAALFRHIQKHGLFTNAVTMIGRVYDKLISDPEGEDGAKFVPTLGEPKTPDTCSECRELLSWDRFTYYQARVKSDGTLMRANALCKSCSEKLNLARKKIWKKQSQTYRRSRSPAMSARTARESGRGTGIAITIIKQASLSRGSAGNAIWRCRTAARRIRN